MSNEVQSITANICKADIQPPLSGEVTYEAAFRDWRNEWRNVYIVFQRRISRGNGEVIEEPHWITRLYWSKGMTHISSFRNETWLRSWLQAKSELERLSKEALAPPNPEAQ